MNGDRRVIVGIGNPSRGDDGVGRKLVKLIKGKLDAEAIELDGEVSELIEILASSEIALIIDAVQHESRVGTLSCFDVHSGKLPAEQFRGSTHALGLEDALELARSLGSLPRRCMVLGISASNFNHGEGLSSELNQQLPELENEVIEVWNKIVRSQKCMKEL